MAKQHPSRLKELKNMARYDKAVAKWNKRIAARDAKRQEQTKETTNDKAS